MPQPVNDRIWKCKKKKIDIEINVKLMKKYIEGNKINEPEDKMIIEKQYLM